MKQLPQHVLGPVLLLGLGAAIAACGVNPEEPFPRDGYADPHASDDDDDGHGGGHGGDFLAGDRVAFWDFIQTRPFGEGDAQYSTSASFFDAQPLGIPQPEGPGECLRNGTDDGDPWLPMGSHDGWGVPLIEADGEEWDLDEIGGAWSRGLPARTWVDYEDYTIGVSGGDFGEGTEYEGALSLPQTLIGVSALLNGEQGLVLEWEAGDLENQLLLVLKTNVDGRTEYVVCTPIDDGDFVVPPEMFEDYPAGDAEMLLRRERTREDWFLVEGSLGRTVGVSQLRAAFTISDGTFGGDSD